MASNTFNSVLSFSLQLSSVLSSRTILRTPRISTYPTHHVNGKPALWRYYTWRGEECQSKRTDTSFDQLSVLLIVIQGLHLLTTNTPNGQKVQIFLEELKELYGTEWTTTLVLVPPLCLQWSPFAYSLPQGI